MQLLMVAKRLAHPRPRHGDGLRLCHWSPSFPQVFVRISRAGSCQEPMFVRVPLLLSARLGLPFRCGTEKLVFLVILFSSHVLRPHSLLLS